VDWCPRLSEDKTALNRISLPVFRVHVETCVTPKAWPKGDPKRRLRLTELVDIFDRLAK
jgi:hypothetical protein